jgi:hypothetical protein
MNIEIFGIVTLAAGLVFLMRPMSFAMPVFFVATLLGAAAAITLPSMGSANIPPAHLLLGFLALNLIRSRDGFSRAAKEWIFPRPGFWLLLTTIYVVFSAVFMPRLFAGLTYVYSVARTDAGPGILLVPLGPVSGNVTQTVYFIGSFVCFIVFAAFMRQPEAFRTAATAGLACGIANLLFGILDLATFYTGTTEYMAFLRNASYRMLNDAEVMGFKRLVGSFPEASAYAYATLGMFAFSGKLWLRGVYSRASAPVAVLSLAALAFSTSTTAYAGLGACLALFGVTSVIAVLRGPAPANTLLFVMVSPVLAALFVMWLALHDEIWITVTTLIEKTLFTKLGTDSGVTRIAWNRQAFVNFSETYGLGAGVGSVRASSFVAAVFGSIGVFGFLTYAAFLFQVTAKMQVRLADSVDDAVRSAARAACFGLMVAASIAGSFIDLGLSFFAFAAIATAQPEPCFMPQALRGRRSFPTFGHGLRLARTPLTRIRS